MHCLMETHISRRWMNIKSIFIGLTLMCTFFFALLYFGYAVDRSTSICGMHLAGFPDSSFSGICCLFVHCCSLCLFYPRARNQHAVQARNGRKWRDERNAFTRLGEKWKLRIFGYFQIIITNRIHSTRNSQLIAKQPLPITDYEQRYANKISML